MRRAAIAVLLLLGGAGVWYLRDPPWLLEQRTGLRLPERGPDGVPYRWSGAHASFFVPSDAGRVRIPVATTFDGRADAAMVVSAFVDDVRAARVLLWDGSWQTLSIDLPPPGSRRVRRIEIRTSVVRDDNHGVKVGEPQLGGR